MADDNPYFDENGAFVPKRLGDEIMQQNIFATENGCIHVWRGGIYRPDGDSLIEKECNRKLGERLTSHRRSEVLEYIRVETNNPEIKFNSDKNSICLKNGVLNLSDMIIANFSPSQMNTIKLDISYNAQAECPAIKKFFSEVVPEENIPLIEEFFGYCLLKSHHIHKAFMLVGGGSNGKSTLLNLLKTFLGTENITSISLQDLEKNRFATSYLRGKLANIYPDLSSKALESTGKFKMLTGGDMIGGEAKFGKHFDFESFCKHIFSTNQMPEVYDESDAFFRRWIIINFPNIFDDSKKDEKLIEKLTTPEELSGLLNIAIVGLKRLLEHGKFSYSKATDEIREQYVRMSDPQASFCMDCIEQSSDAEIEKKALYEAYCDYCRNGRLPILSEETFHKKLVHYINVSSMQHRSGDKRVRIWKGIKFKNEDMSQVAQLAQGKTLSQYSIGIVKEEEVTKKGVPVVPVVPLTTEFNELCFYCHKPTTITIHPNGNSQHICLECLKAHIAGRFNLLGQTSVHISEFDYISEELRKELQTSGFWFEREPEKFMLTS